jgi:GTPase SAR1 family protein
MTKSQWKGAHGVILCYGVNDLNSFKNVSVWISDIKTYADADVDVILVATKIDIPMQQQQVSKDDGLMLAERYNLKFFETSALQNINVKETFQYIVDHVIDRVFANLKLASEQSKGNDNSSVVVSSSQSSLKRQFISCCQ